MAPPNNGGVIMADDNDFDQIVGQIRDALTIPTYGLTDFYGTGVEFEIFDETLSNEVVFITLCGRKTRCPFSMDTVKTATLKP